MNTPQHNVTVTIDNKTIGGWSEYDIQSSMVEPADGFNLTRGCDYDAWQLCRKDAEVKVAVDGVVILNGYIDARERDTSADTMQIEGRDKGGRLVQESIPNPSGFAGLRMRELVAAAVSPWFTTVELSDARNRAVRRGKGKKAAVGEEPAILTVTGANAEEDISGRVDPGETRWNLIEQLISTVGLMAWSSADGRSIVLGKPNYTQAPQYVFRHSIQGSTVKNMRLRESIADSFSKIEMHGTSTGDEDNDAGAVLCSGIALDGPLPDGTGRNFLRPKRLVMSQTSLTSNAEAKLRAELEMKRRNFHLASLTVSCGGHAQSVAFGATPTLFAPNTIARVIDHGLRTDSLWLIYACRYQSGRQGGEVTELMLVPVGTEFVA